MRRLRNTPLGVSSTFSREHNLHTILKRYNINPSLTRSQVNYLSRFTWVGHKKGKNYPECKCLRCEGMHMLSLLDKGEVDSISMSSHLRERYGVLKV